MRRAILLLGVLAACGGTEAVPEIPAGSQSVPFILVNGYFGGSRVRNNWTAAASRQVARTQDEWNQLFQSVTGTTPGPQITFDNQHLFFATTGAKISTGHDIAIDEIWKDPATDRLYVVVRSVVPGTTCSGQSVANSPVTAVLSISEYSGITWLERQSIDRCTSS